MALSGNVERPSIASTIFESETGSKCRAIWEQIASRFACVSRWNEWNMSAPNSRRCRRRKTASPHMSCSAIRTAFFQDINGHGTRENCCRKTKTAAGTKPDGGRLRSDSPRGNLQSGIDVDCLAGGHIDAIRKQRLPAVTNLDPIVALPEVHGLVVFHQTGISAV